MPFVLDASVTLAWGLKDEATAYSVAVLASTNSERATVPLIWALEVANVVLVSERRGRLTTVQSAAFLADLAGLPITIDNVDPKIAWGAVLTMARAYGLTAYDASYLELALRLGLPLASQDNRLRAVATQLGIPIFAPGALDPSSPHGA